METTSNEQKAREIANYFVGEIDKESAAYAYHAAFAMAEWKDEQHAKEKQQWIEKIHKFLIEWACHHIAKQGGSVSQRKALANDILKAYKKAMEE